MNSDIQAIYLEILKNGKRIDTVEIKNNRYLVMTYMPAENHIHQMAFYNLLPPSITGVYK